MILNGPCDSMSPAGRLGANRVREPDWFQAGRWPIRGSSLFSVLYFFYTIYVLPMKKKWDGPLACISLAFFILCLCLCRLASLLSVDPNESQGCIIFCSIMSAWMNLASLLFLSGPPFLILLLFFFGAPSFEIRFLSSSFAAASPSSFSLSLSLSLVRHLFVDSAAILSVERLFFCQRMRQLGRRVNQLGSLNETQPVLLSPVSRDNEIELKDKLPPS